MFGQGTFKLTDRLSITAGVRWTQDDKKLQLIHLREASGALRRRRTRHAGHLQEEWSEVTPKLGLELQATDDVLLYVVVRQGLQERWLQCTPALRHPGSADALRSGDSSTATKSAPRRAGSIGA